ncbi:MAG: nuclear transport factor 2 family protein [Nostoc sp.]|uniref:nuclear transport factor 2 family protein n=1 Tax=Nostoc sp. TaxID=1180 RepID=UPI002FFAE284
MSDQKALLIELLRAAYAAFNARDIDAALALMTADVAWPKAFKGGFVRGSEEVRAYWTEQWSEINPHVEPISFYSEESGRILVDVHQVVRDLDGAVLADEHVGHRFTLEHGLIQAMEVCPLPSSTPPCLTTRSYRTGIGGRPSSVSGVK